MFRILVYFVIPLLLFLQNCYRANVDSNLRKIRNSIFFGTMLHILAIIVLVFSFHIYLCKLRYFIRKLLNFLCVFFFSYMLFSKFVLEVIGIFSTNFFSPWLGWLYVYFTLWLCDDSLLFDWRIKLEKIHFYLWLENRVNVWACNWMASVYRSSVFLGILYS